MERRKVIAGNWKMNMLPNEAIDYIQNFEPMVKDSKAEVILCVPYTDLFYCLMNAQGTNIKIGAQNMHFEESGAFTGEVSRKNAKINWRRICHNWAFRKKTVFCRNRRNSKQKNKSCICKRLKANSLCGRNTRRKRKRKLGRSYYKTNKACPFSD